MAMQIINYWSDSLAILNKAKFICCWQLIIIILKGNIIQMKLKLISE